MELARESDVEDARSPPSVRTAFDRRGWWIALVMILSSLGALLVVPPVFSGREERIRREVEELTTPAHERVDQIDLALAREAAHARAYLLTGRSEYLDAATAAHQRTREALAGLRPLATALGPEVLRRLDEVTQLEARSRSALSALLQPDGPVRADRVELHEELLSDLFRATSQLTEAIDAAAEQRRLRGMESIARQEFITSGLLVFLALCSVVAATVLGRRVRTLALRLEDRVHREARLRTVAERAVAARDDVLLIVAHDLRNPLNAISMSASLVHDIPLAEDKKDHHLRLIQRSTAEMDRLIQDLLDVGRIEAGSFSIAVAPIDAESLLREACETFSARAQASDHLLTCEVGPGNTAIEIDKHRMLQLLGNLLSNAIRHTPEGGSIVLCTRRRGDEVYLSVRDSGPGIPEAEIPHLFDRFWQARNSRRGGAGLGLAIAKGIAEAHGGRIWVESTVGEGSTFWIAIPAAA